MKGTLILEKDDEVITMEVRELILTERVPEVFVTKRGCMEIFESVVDPDSEVTLTATMLTYSTTDWFKLGTVNSSRVHRVVTSQHHEVLINGKWTKVVPEGRSDDE